MYYFTRIQARSQPSAGFREPQIFVSFPELQRVRKPISEFLFCPLIMSESIKNDRRLERHSIELLARVEGRDSAGNKWDEMTRMNDVSAFGAAVGIDRELPVGKLILLTAMMPRQFRSYDFMEPQYRIWGVVRSCREAKGIGKSKPYILGIAFVGRNPPPSYISDPDTLYEITLKPGTDLYELRPKPNSNIQTETFVERETRYQIPINVIAEALDKNSNVIGREAAVMENVSRGGAAIFSSLEVHEGGLVRLTSDEYNATLTGVVRTRRVGNDGIPRLHLEFIDGEFPLGGIDGI